MYFILSPAKKLNETKVELTQVATEPELMDETSKLLKIVQRLKPQDLSDLMSISAKLAQLNCERFAKFAIPQQAEDTFPALFLFNGDAYEGLNASSLSEPSLNYLATNLGLLSGLYGLLRPFDRIYPYRLEMGTKLANANGNNLYAFWADKVTQLLAKRMELSNSKVLINLASNEYFKVIQPQKLKLPVITPVFKDEKNGEYKVISFYAKRARGLMVKFAAENQLTKVEDLKNFDLEGYVFQAKLSSSNELIFTRQEM